MPRALVFPGGRGEVALQRMLEEHDQLVISKATLYELLAILARKFSRDAEELAHVAVCVRSDVHHEALADPTAG